MTPKKHTTDWIPFASLAFDGRYQRGIIPAKIKQLIRDWELNDVGIITVSIRGGKAYVIDGQHRVRAAMELGLGNTKVLCDVYRGLTIEEEARKFLSLNNANKITAVDRYKAGLVAQDRACIGVRDTLAKHGLGISSARSDGYVRCVTEVFRLYDNAPELLDEVCAALVEAWGTRASALERIPLAAMGVVLGRYNGELDRGALTKKLAKYRGGPAALAGDARGLADYKPISITRAAAEIIVDTYNKGRRAGQLSPL